MSSSSLQELFRDSVNRLREQLIAIDEKFPGDDKLEDCIKYTEKLGIYERFTDGLIENSSQYLGVIGHLKEQLGKNDSDGGSIASGSSTPDEKLMEDVECLRTCLETRTALEGKAINSLSKLENVINALLKQNAKLCDENEILNLRVKSDSMSATFDETVTMNIITTLNQENFELRQIIERNKKLKKSIQTQAGQSGMIDSDNSDNIDSSRQIDCAEEINTLQRQLAEKDLLLNQLTSQENKMIRPQTPLSYQAKSNEYQTAESSDADAEADQSARSRKSRRSSSMPSDRSITDSEISDNEKLKIFKDGYQELASILKEKYDQLRKQRAQIDELLKMRSQCLEYEAKLREIQKERDDLLNKSKCLEKEVEGLEQMAGQCSKYEQNLAELEKERDKQLNKTKCLEKEVEELQKKANQCSECEQILAKVQKERDDLLNKSKSLEKEVEGMEVDLRPLREIERQSECWNDEMDKLRDRERYLARKLVIQEDHINTLLCERQNLIQLNNDMLNSISTCKKEFDRYATD